MLEKMGGGGVLYRHLSRRIVDMLKLGFPIPLGMRPNF